ncbi:hypothetical protein H6P81_014385 [Aristolochia fimbriata]|uniref:Acid phosphatase/vanadium-dependent haloperoxidase-related protein n=1 Tax=Aristolochia fimbriata TaxID=158543 RepID=A0AAV7EL00_ARIFI|nr:hypothetical protein H6P81_014385 [Aristolochia fimbriata]
MDAGRVLFSPCSKFGTFNARPSCCFKLSHDFLKCKTFPISLSCKVPPNPSTSKPPFKHSLPVSLLGVVAPVFQSIRDFSLSGCSKRIFSLGSSIEKRVSRLRGLGASATASFSDGPDGEYLQNGGIGMLLLSTTTAAKVHISPFIATLSSNPTFVSGLLAWVLAQSAKVFLHFFVEKKWDLGILVSSGGMPSSHSALCTALTASVALCHGVADALFPVCLGFSLIVMYDATGVRRHAGMQAEVLNMIVEDLFQGHPISQRKLKELLGHTPSQVVAGAFLGILVACFCCQGHVVAI